MRGPPENAGPAPRSGGDGAQKVDRLGTEIVHKNTDEGRAGQPLPVMIAEWPRNSREMIRVRLDVFNGRDVVDVRTWYRSAEGEMKPGRSGLTLSVRHLPALAQALTRALVKARELGLLTGEEARE